MNIKMVRVPKTLRRSQPVCFLHSNRCLQHYCVFPARLLSYMKIWFPELRNAPHSCQVYLIRLNSLHDGVGRCATAISRCQVDCHSCMVSLTSPAYTKNKDHCAGGARTDIFCSFTKLFVQGKMPIPSSARSVRHIEIATRMRVDNLSESNPISGPSFLLVTLFPIAQKMPELFFLSEPISMLTIPSSLTTWTNPTRASMSWSQPYRARAAFAELSPRP